MTRWLGEFTLPFGTLYRNGKVRGAPQYLPISKPSPTPNPQLLPPAQVEGRFPLSMPPILLGYEKVRDTREM